MQFTVTEQLKSDAFGSIEKGQLVRDGQSITGIRRVYTQNPWLRPFAKFLARREKKAIKQLAGITHHNQLPELLFEDKDGHIRSYIEGSSMHRHPNQKDFNAAFFKSAANLILRMRQRGVCNNDLAKEANWIINDQGLPAVTDFQLAICFNNKQSRLLRILAREDLRHLYKHQRTYLRHLSTAQQAILNQKSTLSKIWHVTFKKTYLFITRRILGWKDRTGPEERNI